MAEKHLQALPVPIASWSDFRAAVSQLCTPKGRENFDTVVIDTYTNLILLLDKYIGNKMTTEKNTYDFGSDADYGKGTKAMKNELGIQLQKLANQGYLLMNIVHAEDKTDFATQRSYIGTSLSNSLYGVAEKFVDQIIYLRKDENAKGEIEHRIWFNSKGGFTGAGGRFTPDVDSVPCSFKNLEKALLGAIETIGTQDGVKLIESNKPSVTIDEPIYDFNAMRDEFSELVGKIMQANPANGALITGIVDKYLGKGKKVGDCTPSQCEQLDLILVEMRDLDKQTN